MSGFIRKREILKTLPTMLRLYGVGIVVDSLLARNNTPFMTILIRHNYFGS